MHDIFISYSHQDTNMMQRVAAVLRESGLTVWTDEGIEPGTSSWRDAIATAILNCRNVFALFSPASANSTWVSRELDYAELHKKAIYPLLVKGDVTSAIPFGYTTFQFVDIRDDLLFDAGIKNLIQQLSKPDEPVETSPPVVSSSARDTWQWIEPGSVFLSIPAHWSFYEPTPQNIQRLQILMMGNDETLFYRAVEDFHSNFVAQAVGLKIGSLNSLCTMSSIAELSPLVGFLAEYRSPWILPGFLMPGVMSVLKQRIVNFMQSRYRSELSDFRWKCTGVGRIWSYKWEFPSILENTQGMKGKVFTIFPPYSRRSLFLVLMCEEKRFPQEMQRFDRIAASIQFTYS